MTRFGNSGVEKNSRMARRYAMPATPIQIRKDGSPTLLNLREQIASAKSKTAPSPYSLTAGVSFTALPCALSLLFVPTPRTRQRFAAPLLERAVAPPRAALSRPLRRYRRKAPSGQRRVQVPGHAPARPAAHL